MKEYEDRGLTVFGPNSCCPNGIEISEEVNFHLVVPDHKCEPVSVVMTVSNGPERTWNQCKVCGKPM